MSTIEDTQSLSGRPAWADEDVLQEIVRAQGPALLAYARGVTGHAQDAEDALQEALFKVAGQRASRIENVRAYLYKAIRNAALNGFRARIRRLRREQAVQAPTIPLFQEPAARREELQALNEAVALLPEEQREVVLMKVWGGLSFTDIAESTGAPRDTVASRYRYAIDALRKHMRKFIDE